VDQFALEGANSFCAGTLGAFAYLERDLLSLLELVETDALNGRHVEEHVLATACLDESKTLVSETLDRTFSHYLNSS
jgi:hypothetical protein